MAYKIKDIYPSQVSTGDAGWPDGKPRNIQGGIQGTGTPFEEKLFQDYEGSRQALFAEAGVVPSGVADRVGQSDFVGALKKIQSTKSRQSIIALYKAQGYNNVFFFKDGFTYTESNDVGIYEDGTAWTYADAGALPVTVAADTVPSEGVYSSVMMNNAESILLNSGESVQSAIDTMSAPSIEALINVNLTTNRLVTVSSYHEGESYSGGGVFVFGEGVHDGGSFIDPERTYPNDFNDQTQLSEWLNNSGGVVSGWKRILNECSQPSMFGARELFDATKCTQSALIYSDLSGLPFELDLDYSASGTLSVNSDTRKGKGSITYTGSNAIPLTVDSDCVVEGLVIDGGFAARTGVAINADNVTFRYNKISKVKASSTASIGVRVTGTGNIDVTNNDISDIDAVTTGTIGSSLGASIAIFAEFSADRSGNLNIKRNKCTSITGREGSAIHLQATDTSLKANAEVMNNEISLCTKRAVKLQCSGATVRFNSYEHGFTALEAPNALSAFDAIGPATDIHIDFNTIDDGEGGAIVQGISTAFIDSPSITFNVINIGYNNSSTVGWLPRGNQTGINSNGDYSPIITSNIINGGYVGIANFSVNAKIKNNDGVFGFLGELLGSHFITSRAADYAIISDNSEAGGLGFRTGGVNLTNVNKSKVTHNNFNYGETNSYYALILAGTSALAKSTGNVISGNSNNSNSELTLKTNVYSDLVDNTVIDNYNLGSGGVS